MTKSTRLLAPFCCILLSIAASQAQYHSLQPLAGFGPNSDGFMLADGSLPFLTTGAIQRGMARNPVTGNIILVDRGVAGQTSTFSGGIYVLDGNTGAVISTLSGNGISGGSFAHYTVGVADDGAIYVGNVIADTNAGPYIVYRYDGETGTNDPVVAFSGVMGTNNFRWGNTIDVRGSGPGTQILVSSGGNEAAVLTTANGTNFSSTILRADFTASLQGTLFFGSGDTYWAKFANLDLRVLSFNLTNGSATTIKILGGTDLPEFVAPEIAALDSTKTLLGVVNYHGNTAPDEVLLYNISNTNDYPQLQDSYTITSINNANSGSPKGYLAFGTGRLYNHNLNNGLFAFAMPSNSVPAPIILADPQPVSILVSNTAKFKVVAQRGVYFQWLKANSPILGATNSFLTLTNVQTGDAGNYSVIVSNATGSVTSGNALLTVLQLSDVYHATQIWSAAPNTQPYFTTTGGSAGTPNQRSLAYNPITGHLYVLSRANSSAAYFTITVINPETGAPLYTLNTNGVNFTNWDGQIGLLGIDVSDDGSIYAGNLDTANPNGWRLYRWANDAPSTQPVMVFAGDPLNSGSSFRWGDTLAARGSGTNTEVIIDIQGANPGYVAVLKPADEFLTNFISSFWFPENTNGSTAGRSLIFGTGNTFWQRRKTTPLVQSSYSSENPIAPITRYITSLPANIGLVCIDETRHLLGGVNFSGVTGTSPDTVDLYEVSDFTTPTLLSRINFPVNHVNNTPNIGKIVFGGNKMFALESQNGIVAARIDFGVPVALNLVRSGNDVNLSWVGNGFVLEGTTNVTSGTWVNIPFTLGPTNTATDPISGTARFYRLRK